MLLFYSYPDIVLFFDTWPLLMTVSNTFATTIDSSVKSRFLLRIHSSLMEFLQLRQKFSIFLIHYKLTLESSTVEVLVQKRNITWYFWYVPQKVHKKMTQPRIVLPKFFYLKHWIRNNKGTNVVSRLILNDIISQILFICIWHWTRCYDSQWERSFFDEYCQFGCNWLRM